MLHASAGRAHLRAKRPLGHDEAERVEPGKAVVDSEVGNAVDSNHDNLPPAGRVAK